MAGAEWLNRCRWSRWRRRAPACTGYRCWRFWRAADWQPYWWTRGEQDAAHAKVPGPEARAGARRSLQCAGGHGYANLARHGRWGAGPGKLAGGPSVPSGTKPADVRRHRGATTSAVIHGTTSCIAQNWLDPGAERGLSTFDQRQLLSLQVQYTTGMGIAGGTLLTGWRGTLFKEWTFATQITAGSGLPETPVYQAPVQGTGVTGTIRPDYTGAALYAAAPGFFLNPAAYTAPLPGQWGNAGRDSITGPAQFTLNASVGRIFRVSDRFNLDVRADSTNPLNHVTFTTWNTIVNSTQFGLPAAANTMRSLQLTLRLRF